MQMNFGRECPLRYNNAAQSVTRPRNSGRCYLKLGARIRHLLPRLALAMSPLLVAIVVGELFLPPPDGDQTGEAAGSAKYLVCRADSALGWVFPSDTSGVFPAGEYPTSVVTDGMGLRNPPREVAAPNDTAGAYTVLVLGDSYVFGWGVAETNCFPRILERLLRESRHRPELRVINAGIPGYGPLQQRRAMARVLQRERVDLVIGTVSLGNDSVDELRLERHDDDGLLNYRPDVRAPDSHMARLIRSSRLLTWLDTRTGPLQFAWQNSCSKPVSLARDSFMGLADDCAAVDLPLLLLVIPRRSEIVRPGAIMRLATWLIMRCPRGMVRSLEEQEGSRVLDLTPYLRQAAAEGSVYLTNDPHWSPRGHEVVAVAAAAALDRDYLP